MSVQLVAYTEHGNDLHESSSRLGEVGFVVGMLVEVGAENVGRVGGRPGACVGLVAASMEVVDSGVVSVVKAVVAVDVAGVVVMVVVVVVVVVVIAIHFRQYFSHVPSLRQANSSFSPLRGT